MEVTQYQQDDRFGEHPTDLEPVVSKLGTIVCRAVLGYSRSPQQSEFDLTFTFASLTAPASSSGSLEQKTHSRNNHRPTEQCRSQTSLAQS